MIYMGIDPGTVTGLALWQSQAKSLELYSGTFIEIYARLINGFSIAPPDDYLIRIEDARLRKWYGPRDGPGQTGKLQGAGSIKRDCTIWEEVCIFHGWNYRMVHPIKGGTKWSAAAFKAATGYQGRTNGHVRDAAMLVYNLP